MTVIPVARIEYEIVSSAIDDSTGLYEVIWILNSLYPSVSRLDKISYCKPAIIDLLQRGIICLYKTAWNTRVEQQIEKETALEIVTFDASWNEPNKNSDGHYYCFAATDDHEKALDEEQRLYVHINGG